jgi:hypothetical protein
MFPEIYPTKCDDSFCQWCTLKFSRTCPNFRSRGDPRRPGSSSNRPLLPVLDLTSPLPGISIHISINRLPIWMHIPHHVAFPHVGYMFPKWITQGSSWCPQERARRINCPWMNLPCLGLLISHSVDCQSRPSCVRNVPHYDEYLYSNHFWINASNHRESANVYRVLCRHNRFNQPSSSSNTNLKTFISFEPYLRFKWFLCPIICSVE